MVATLPRRLALRLLNEMRRQKWNVFLSYISFEMHAQLSHFLPRAIAVYATTRAAKALRNQYKPAENSKQAKGGLPILCKLLSRRACLEHLHLSSQVFLNLGLEDRSKYLREGGRAKHAPSKVDPSAQLRLAARGISSRRGHPRRRFRPQRQPRVQNVSPH